MCEEKSNTAKVTRDELTFFDSNKHIRDNKHIKTPSFACIGSDVSSAHQTESSIMCEYNTQTKHKWVKERLNATDLNPQLEKYPFLVLEKHNSIFAPYLPLMCA